MHKVRLPLIALIIMFVVVVALIAGLLLFYKGLNVNTSPAPSSVPTSTPTVTSIGVNVSGVVTVYSYYPDVYLDSIQFQDAQTRFNYTVSFSAVFYRNADNYSVVLPNGHSYNVTVNFHHGVGSALFPAAAYLGELVVHVPAGNDTITNLNYTKYFE